jgi:predicted DCC family thiol-disulfide oxidoreductase YuxK
MRRSHLNQSKRVLLFDGVCNLCNQFVDFLIRRPGYPADLKLGALQSEFSKGLAAERPDLNLFALDTAVLNTVVLAEWNERGDLETYTESDAVLRVLTSLGGLWLVANVAFWIPRRIRNGVYRWVAKNRNLWFGQRDTCRLPTAEERDRFVD